MGGGQAISGAVVNLYDKWAAQVQNLKDGYNTVADAYSNIDKFGKLAAAESQDLADIVFDGTNKDAILNAIFGDANSSEKAAFAADLAVYQKGHYFLQKQRFGADTGAGSTAPTKANVTASIETLISNPNFNANGITPIVKTNGVVTNMPAILSELQTRMLNQMNSAIGVGAITNTTNQDRIEELNGYLLNQIGEDRGQFNALFDDINDLDTGTPALNRTILKDFFSDNYHLTMESQKAGQLNSDFNFNLELLKPNGKDIDIQMA